MDFALWKQNPFLFINSCSANFGENKPSNNQISTSNDYVGNLRWCPPNLPICDGYVANSHYGKCIQKKIDPLQPKVDLLNTQVANLQNEINQDNSKITNLNNQINQKNSLISGQQSKISTLQTQLNNDENTINDQKQQIKDDLDKISGLQTENRELSDDLKTTEEQLDNTKSLATILSINKKLSLLGANNIGEQIGNIVENTKELDNINLKLNDFSSDIKKIEQNNLKASETITQFENSYDKNVFEMEQKQQLIDTRRGMLLNQKKRSKYNQKLIMFILSLNLLLLILIAIMYIKYMKS